MLRFDIQNNQTIMLAVIGGAAFVILVVVFYIDLWKPRKEKEDEPGKPETRYLKWWQGIPWSLKITYIFSALYAVLYTLYRIFYPPDW